MPLDATYRRLYRTYTAPNTVRYARSSGVPDIPIGNVQPPTGNGQDVITKFRMTAAGVTTGSGRDSLLYNTTNAMQFKITPEDYVGVLPGSTLTRTPASGEADYTVPGSAANSVPTVYMGVATGSTGTGTPVQDRDFFGIPRVGSLANVYFKNCIFRGTLATGSLTGCVEATGLNFRGAVFEDCTFIVRNNNTWHTGIRGSNHTIARCEITGAADGLTLNGTGGNVKAYGNWLHNGAYDEWNAGDAAYQPQGDNYLHCDGVQFHMGPNYYLRGNYIGGQRTGRWSHHAGQKANILADDDFYLSGMLMAQAPVQADGQQYKITGVAEQNVIEGGSVAINVATSNGYDLAGFEFRDNIIVRNSFSLAYIKKPVDCNCVFTNNRHPDGALVTIVG